MKQLPTIILFISLTGGLFSNIELYYQNNLGDFLNTKQSLKKSLIKEAEINDFNLVFSEGLQLLMLKSDKSTLYPQNSLITFYSQIGNSTDEHLSLTPSALQLTLQSYNTLLNPSKSTSLLLPLDHRSTYSEFNFAMTTAYTLGENLQFNIGGEVNDLTFNPNTTNRNLRNRSVFTIPVNLSYSITPDVNLRVGLTTKGTRLEKGLTYHDKLVNVGVEGKISKNLSSEFSVGVQDRSLNKTPLSEDLATSTKLNYKLTDKTSVSSTIKKDYSIDGAGESTQSLSRSIDIDYSLNELLLLGTNFSINNFDYLNGTQKETTNTGVHVQFSPTKSIKFSAGYAYSINEIEQQLENKNHLLNFSASLRF